MIESNSIAITFNANMWSGMQDISSAALLNIKDAPQQPTSTARNGPTNNFNTVSKKCFETKLFICFNESKIIQTIIVLIDSVNSQPAGQSVGVHLFLLTSS